MTFAQTRQPDTLWELIYAFDYTFSNILTPEELEQRRTLSPEELKEQAPDTYEKVSQNVVRWTNDWVEYVSRTLETVPPERLAEGRRRAESVNRILREFFESKGWEYKPLEVVFLPQRVFHDKRNRSWQTRGMTVPYYPGAFFATIDPSAPMDLILVHETLHFNKRGRTYGSRLTEGLTETAARYIVRKYELLTPHQMRKEEYYPEERRRVDVILEQIEAHASCSPEEAVELLLEAYLTGRQDKMCELFGEQAWEAVIALSRSSRWYKSDILAALSR